MTDRVAEHVGHKSATLQKHYLIPEIKPAFIEKGKILSIDVENYEIGGELKETVKRKADPKRKSVGIAFILNNKEILLVHHPEEKKPDEPLSIPKGRYEDKELGFPFLTAHREIQEEIGIHVPFKWLMQQPIHSVLNSEGRETEYYIVHINNLKVLDLTKSVVPKNQYQKDEVDSTPGPRTSSRPGRAFVRRWSAVFRRLRRDTPS